MEIHFLLLNAPSKQLSMTIHKRKLYDSSKENYRILIFLSLFFSGLANPDFNVKDYS